MKRENEEPPESQVLLDAQEMMVSVGQSDFRVPLEIKEIGVLQVLMASQDPLDHRVLRVLRASGGDRVILDLKEMMVQSELQERRERPVSRVMLVSQENTDLMANQELQERRESQGFLEPLVSEELWEFLVCQENKDLWELRA